MREREREKTGNKSLHLLMSNNLSFIQGKKMTVIAIACYCYIFKVTASAWLYTQGSIV